MRITGIEPVVVQVNHRGDWVFVLVHTDEDITGLGEASHSSNDSLALDALAGYSHRLCGEDPMRIEAISAQLRNRNTGRVQNTVISAIEQALWDIVGQYCNVPIHTLFGGPIRDRLRLYANINRHVVDRSPDGFERAARKAVGEGFTALKLAPFDELRGPDHVRTGPDAAWRMGVERVAAVRRALGPTVEIAVDCHGRMDASEALIVAGALAEMGLFWYEEPVPHHLVSELAFVTRQTTIPTASAESVFGIEGFRPFLSRRIVDVIMPDVKHDGGLLETKRIAGAARMSGLLVAPHNPAGPVSTAASAHVMSTETSFLILEYAWGEVAWRAELLDPPERVEQGYLCLPTGPGLGHRLNRAVVDAHRSLMADSKDSTMALPL